MVKSAYLLSLHRLFKNHIVRFFSISAIFVVVIGLLSGIGDSSRSMVKTEKNIYDTGNVHDFVVMGTETNPMKLIQVMSTTYDELNNNKDKYGIEKIEKAISQDKDLGEGGVIRYTYQNLSKREIDKFELEKGRFPETEYEVVAEHFTKDIKEVELGTKFIEPTTNKECTIVGVVKNPSIFATSKEKSFIKANDISEETKNLNAIYYINEMSLVNNAYNQLFITFRDRSNNLFTDEYKKKTDNFVNLVNELTFTISGQEVKGKDSLKTLTLYDNYSFRVLDGFADKVTNVASMFMVVFLAILVLMVYSTMSRLLDEERPSIAALKTLGYSNGSISARYIIFIAFAALVGIAISIGPSVLVNYIITKSFKYQLVIANPIISALGINFLILSLVSFIASIILVAISNHFVLKKKPVELLVSKTPKFGKKILLEKIKLIWKKLSFKHKSTLRNIFLFKSRLIMTLLSVILSSAMVFVSFSMLSNSFDMGAGSMKIISLTVLVFSGILSALIVYNITNINISERKRELATLMVLGYNDKETSGYIFREIFITVIIASFIGLPIAVGICKFILDYADFGTLSVVEWYWYVLTPVCTIVFSGIAMILLRPKIVKIDINDSLKMLE